MREILLSFRSEYYKVLLYGLKKYEYRKRFCDEETRAFLYLSRKERKVVGVLELGKPICLDITIDDYKKYPETLKRVKSYVSNRDINAIPIKSLTLFAKPLSIEEIKKEIPSFRPPEMYYNLDNNLKLKELLERQELKEKVFEHKHDTIYYDNLAVSVKELEQTKEFKKADDERKY